MWLRLTLYNGDPIVIDFNKVEAFGLTEENGANSYVSLANGTYQVKDTVDGILQMLSFDKENLASKEPTKEWR